MADVLCEAFKQIVSRTDCIELYLPRDAKPMIARYNAVVMCLFVCLSHSAIVSKQLNIESHKHSHMHDSPGTRVF